MLFLFPINTDAPVNYFPAGTIGLIVTNIVVFILTGLNQRPDLADPWILWFGAIRPHQWLTAFFMHAGFAHLIGNMIFLWAFGLVVEGKLGWKKFIPLYLMLGISQCAVEQFVMWGADAEGQRREQMECLGLLDEDDADV
ncbi:MAG: rhomboid family intramembrane serine protease, partial [Planctomycetaceae bacterium]